MHRLQTKTTDEFSQEQIFTDIILPLIKRHEETLWFADNNVAVTPENTNAQQEPGWTHELINRGMIEGGSVKGKYIELERMLSSIVFLHLFHDGSKAAYKKFISIQNKKIALSWESFQSIHDLAKRVVKNTALFQAVEAMLVYSDLGKTPKGREKAKELDIHCADHDDWVEAVLSQGNTANVSRIFPSFFTLSTENKQLLKQVAMAMKIHLGHVAHLEGGVKMFDKFQAAVSRGMVDREIMELAFLIQYCDVAASAAHENNKGSSALVEGSYQVYTAVFSALEVIVNGGNAEEALNLYIKKRGQQLNLNRDEVKEMLLIRLSCMSRFYNDENSELLKELAGELTEPSWAVLKSQFDLFSGINSWERNPTYIPAIFINLAQLSNTQEAKRDKLYRILNGFVCVAKLLEHYGQEKDNINNKTPLCCNDLAKLATNQPEQFLIEQFDPRKFHVNANHNYVLGETPNVYVRKPT